MCMLCNKSDQTHTTFRDSLAAVIQTLKQLVNLFLKMIAAYYADGYDICLCYAT